MWIFEKSKIEFTQVEPSDHFSTYAVMNPLHFIHGRTIW